MSTKIKSPSLNYLLIQHGPGQKMLKKSSVAFLIGLKQINTYPADHDYCRFQSVLSVDKITVIEMKCVFKHQDLQIFVLNF